MLLLGRIQSRLSELVGEMPNGPIRSSKGAKGHEPVKSSHCPSQAERGWGVKNPHPTLFLPDCKPGTTSEILGGTIPKGCC